METTKLTVLLTLFFLNTGFLSLSAQTDCTTNATCLTNASCGTIGATGQVCDEILFRIYWVRRGVGNVSGGNDPQLKLTYQGQTYDMGFTFDTDATNTTYTQFYERPTSCVDGCPLEWPLDLNIPCGAQSIELELEFFENDGPFCNDFDPGDTFREFKTVTIDLSSISTTGTTGFTTTPDFMDPNETFRFGTEITYSFAYEFFCNSYADSCNTQPPVDPEIPTISQWGLFILGMMLSILALVFVYIRRPKPTN